MKITRSVKCYFKKYLTESKKQILNGILEVYHNIVTEAIDIFKNEMVEDEASSFYFTLAENLNKITTKAPARLKKNAVSEAFGLVSGTYKASLALASKYSVPTHNPNRMVLSQTNAQIILDPETKEFDLMLKIGAYGTRGSSLYIPLKKNALFNKWAGLGKLNNSVLITKDYVQFSFTIETGKKKLEGEMLGVDIGMNKLLATTQRKFIGDGIIREKLEILHRKKFASKGYYRAKEDLKETINKLCKELPWSELSMIVVENLKNLKKGTKKKKSKKYRRKSKAFRRLLHNWNYRQVLARIQALSEENRVSFRSVSPWKTSQTCPICGHVEQKNRLSQELFCCQKCGHSDNADFVGAQNILNRFITGSYGISCKSENMDIKAHV